MRHILLILCFLVFGLKNSFAEIRKEIDSASNIISYYNDLNLKFILNTKYNNLIIDSEALSDEIRWKTNDNNTLGFGFNYKWVGLNVLFNIRDINDDDHIYGKTNSFNVIANFYSKKFGLDVHLQESEGFYLENSSSWYPNRSADLPFPSRPGLNMRLIGSNFLYVLNSEDFSLRSNFILNERQIKSAGSPIVGAYFNSFQLNSDSSFLPFTADTISEYQIDIKDAGYLNLGSFVGYSHNFIIQKKLFISLTGALGLALQLSEIKTHIDTYDNEDRQAINAKLHIRAALGYSDDDFFMSLALIADNNGLGKSVNYNFGFARLTFGYRIKMKKRKSGQ